MRTFFVRANKVDRNVSRKTSLVKNETFDSQDTHPYVAI